MIRHWTAILACTHSHLSLSFRRLTVQPQMETLALVSLVLDNIQQRPTLPSTWATKSFHFRLRMMSMPWQDPQRTCRLLTLGLRWQVEHGVRSPLIQRSMGGMSTTSMVTIST